MDIADRVEDEELQQKTERRHCRGAGQSGQSGYLGAGEKSGFENAEGGRRCGVAGHHAWTPVRVHLLVRL